HGAIAIDKDCAYESASYGLFQIMGFNCVICGYANADAKFGQAKANALAQLYPTLVNAKAGGYTGGDAELERLHGAIAIDKDCAYESASYGLFQIMGFNCVICGYA
ncbi:hypothetical protein CQA65_30210, partial [Klebsiella pneumoniae]